MQTAVNNIETSWKYLLKSELQSAYFAQLITFIANEKKAGKNIYPESKNIFAALNETPFDKVKIVIIGQDPYHGKGQAHGLSFSVLPGIKIPPSLKNMYKELHADLGILPSTNGCLQAWAHQGVLLLNTCLTVEEDKPNSHAHIGWAQFTDTIISLLNNSKESIIFFLWGKFAQQKKIFYKQ